MNDDPDTICAREAGLRGAFHGRRAGSVFSLTWLAFPAADLATSSPSPARVALVAAAVAGFAALYMRRSGARSRGGRRGRFAALAALAAGASALTLADRTSWSLLFVLVATVAGLALAQREAMLAIGATACARTRRPDALRR